MTNSPQSCSADIAQACAKFVMWCMNEGSFEGCDINGGEAQDKAVELGLLDATTYDPNRHGPSDCCEQGDNWYVPMPELISLLSGAPAQSVGMRDALEGIRIYTSDTLSGRADGPDDREWQREAVVEINRRARVALASQPSPAATVETKSAPELGPSQNNAERLPSSDAAESGAGTQCSADREVLIEAEAKKRCLRDGHSLERLACEERIFRHDDRRPLWQAMYCPQIEREIERLKKAGFAVTTNEPQEAPVFDLTNHHNAAKCPYCTPEGYALVPREVTEEMLAAGAQALADDVWHPPQKFSSLPAHDQNRFTRHALLVLKAATAPLSRPTLGGGK